MKSIFQSFFLTGLMAALIISPSFAQTNSQRIATLVKYYADENLFNGSILVAEKGEVIYKNAVGKANMEWDIPNTPDTKFRIGSISKQFTSMLIMQLVNEGKIELQKSVTAYLPHYRKETGDSITVQHLLTHSSGIPNYTDNDEFYKQATKPFSVPDFVRLYCSGDLEFKPGTRFSYSNSGYFILGAIIEAVSKLPYEKVLQQRILSPLKMYNTGYDHSETIIANRAAGYVRRYNGFKNADYLHMSLPFAAGSLYSTVEDLFKWNLALYTDQLLPESQKQRMFTGSLPVDDAVFFKDDKDSIASGWFVKNFHKKDTAQVGKMIWHSGGINGFLTELVRFPEDGNFITLLDNTEGSTEPLLKDIMSILYDLPTTPKKKTFTNALQQKIKKDGVKAATLYFTSMDSSARAQYEFAGTERRINQWGYQLLDDENKTDEALQLFELNTKIFPKSFNVYDSYADALAKAGRKEEAIKNYQKSAELNPARKRRVQFSVNALELQPDTLKVTVDGHEMVLYKYGSKGPAILLESGGNSDHNSWNSIVGELSKTATVITYDRPGYLQSVACNRPRTADRVAAELYEALQKANIKGPYVIGGWSWGGAFAKVFAAKYAKDTKGLVLVDPADGNVYNEMAAKYPDAFTRSFQERIARNHAAQDEFDAMLPVMHQASEADKAYQGNTVLLIAGSYEEWKGDEPSKKI